MSDGSKRYQRKARNYLLDPQFQLKYTGLLVGIALALSVGLGVVLWSTSAKVIDQSQRTVQQGTETVKHGLETVERGKLVIAESKKVNQVVTMTMSNCYGDNPDLLKTFKDQTADDDVKKNDEQKRLEKDAEELKQREAELANQAAEVARQQRQILWGLAGGLGILVIGIGVAGIVFTHKIAGPIFKMKRLLRQVGEGKLVLREKLRKGDELQHFFETFEKMVNDLRRRQQDEIAKVDAILAQLEDEPISQRGGKEVDAAGMALLKKLRQEMVDHIQD